jgi:hypothetical protein
MARRMRLAEAEFAAIYSGIERAADACLHMSASVDNFCFQERLYATVACVDERAG